MPMLRPSFSGVVSEEQKAKERDAKFKAGWRLPPRYEVLQPLGQGAYGQVCEAEDKEKQRKVAIKQAKHLLDDLIDAKRILREVTMLSRLIHPNVCQLHDLVIPSDLVTFNEIYMVLERCDSDLRKLCRAEVHLSHRHITTLLYGLLVGLNYLHSAGIWHRDLKPANVLVNEDCSLKICDFGLSRAVAGNARGFEVPDEKSKRVLTGHVVTRWYRAPELVLLQEQYTEAIDVWSVGCIYAELLGMLEGTKFKDRGPLFPGRTCFPLSPHEHHKTDTKYYSAGDKDQLSMICGLLGTPSDEEIAHLHGADARAYMRCFAKQEGTGLGPRFASLDNMGCNLMEQMLVFNSKQRITTADALNHAIFAKVRDPKRETTAEAVIDLDFEREDDLDAKKLRTYFRREIRKFHPELPDM